MYFLEKNLYISKSNNILFDLKDGGIYKVNNEFINLIGGKGNINTNDLDSNDKELYEKISNNNINYYDSIDSLKIHVSNACNLKCKYCYANQGNYGKETKIMNSDVVNKLINFIDAYIKNHKLKHIAFFGGEPLLAIEILNKFVKNLRIWVLFFCFKQTGQL